ncbi:UDP-galactopyranose mutase, partial [Enterococcus faecalis]
HKENGINVHDYAAHIFHTDNKEVSSYVNQLTKFNGYINQVVANYKGELYNLPFNMNRFNQMWAEKTQAEEQEKISVQRKAP